MSDRAALRHRAATSGTRVFGSAVQGKTVSRLFYEALLDHLDRREPIAVATVVSVHGSASARLGSKCIISMDGRNRIGWVGGGCAESYVIQHAQEAIRDGRPRRIDVDLNDEAFGVGMPCGGQLEVYIEPMSPPKRLLILGEDATTHWLTRWANRLDLQVVTDPEQLEPEDAEYLVLRPGAATESGLWDHHSGRITASLRIHELTPSQEAVCLAASLLMKETSASGRPISRTDGRASLIGADRRGGAEPPHLVIVGHNRITEHLAALGASLDWTVTVNSPGASAEAYAPTVCRILDDDAYALEEVDHGSLVVVATQHKGDHLILQSIADRRPSYIGVVASRTRAALLRDFLESDSRFQPLLDRLHAPCGLDLGARSPFEIALSIVCELLEELGVAQEHQV